MKSKTKYILPVLCLSLLAGSAMAGVTGTEFQALYNWLNNIITGYGGRAIALAAIGIGALMSIGKGPIPILSGVGFAILLQYAPTIVTGVLTATI